MKIILNVSVDLLDIRNYGMRSEGLMYTEGRDIIRRSILILRYEETYWLLDVYEMSRLNFRNNDNSWLVLIPDIQERVWKRLRECFNP